MLFRVLWHTPEPEKLIGVAMRRCYTTYPVETILQEVTPEYGNYLVASAYERSEFDVYEHARILCEAEATEKEVLETLLRHRYMEATRLDSNWLFSFNLRTAVESARLGEHSLTAVVNEVCPVVTLMMNGGKRPARPQRLEIKPQQAPSSIHVDILQALTPSDVQRIVSQLGKHSLSLEETVKHCFMTFEIEGISRVASHQLVRHRPASYSQESQRFSAAVEEDFIIPSTISQHGQALSTAQSAMNFARETYAKLRELGIKKEDARFVLPLATGTKLMMTITAKYLRHITFFRGSTSPVGEKAQWEIREIVDAMAREAAKLMPELDWTPREAL